jgi:hypothetical protein
VRPRIAVQDDTVPARQVVRLAGFARPQALLAADGDVEMTLPTPNPGQKSEIEAKCRLPNTLIVPITPPDEPVLPVNLLQTKFSSHLLFSDGMEKANYSDFGGSVLEATCGGQSRPTLSLHPPPAGRSLADWWLKLPATAARLVTGIGIRDGAKSNGVDFAIEVNGRNVFDKTLQPASGWVPVEISLSQWKNQPVVLTLLTDSLGELPSAGAVWAEPRLVPKP